MEYSPGISSVAALLADPGRAAMVWALMDGSARPAGELALLAGLSPSSASAHLAKLTEGGLLVQQSHGRNRYYALAGPEVGQAVEALAGAALATLPRKSRVVPASRGTPMAMREARTCYDHLAGELAVGVFERMSAAGWLAQDGKRVTITDAGTQGLQALGIDVPAVAQRRRQLACACPDWSERKPHLGGAIGAALLLRCKEAGWVRPSNSSRALHVSPEGRQVIGAIAQ
ncbi:helix-turn-helix transcriptional regulator [Pseudomonas sp. GD03944]|uniref:ArsR/SmtB family transcription factor n=1 Tax=Pseudomonas sp. GD03944 TaxID=2975409 RepID=UPI00244A889F|nr:helix-turn-helix transcriptional regulator [Pseudomonas sp. GD03944]MDH1264489.1 ArsR family transcriptional regulator [Pseudomonas sp. GD03944]